MLVKRSRNLFKDAPLGNYTKESGATCGEKTNENRLWYKVKQIVYENDALFYFGVCMVAILLALVGRYIYFLSEIPAEVFKVYLLIPLSNLLRFFTVLMGDCSSGDFKHFFSTNFEFDIIYICNFILLSMIIYGFLKEQYDKLYARKAR